MKAKDTRDGDSHTSPRTVGTALAGRASQRRVDSPLARSLRRFLGHRLALTGSIAVLVLALAAIFAPLVAPYDPNAVDLDRVSHPPDRQNLLGTDATGRDVLSRLIFGARVSMSVGIVAVSIYLSIGFVLGAVSGYVGGKVDMLIMRFTDIMMCFPSFVLILILVAILGPSIRNVMLVIGLFGWPGIARLVRGQVLSLREQDFILAARTIGVPHRRMLLVHLLPNVLGPVTVAGTLGIAGAILTEAGLSFLGLGVRPPTASWGSMISQARSIAVLTDMPWQWLSPGIAISVAVLSINFIGDGLRDAIDIRSRKVQA
jgi:peptide/nickel transport system permease protein